MGAIRAFGGAPVTASFCDMEPSREEGFGGTKFRRPEWKPVAQSVSAKYHGWYDIPVQTAQASDNLGLGGDNARCRCVRFRFMQG
jgi:hypothetical protein